MAKFIKATVAGKNELINIYLIQRVRPTGTSSYLIIFHGYNEKTISIPIGKKADGDYLEVEEPHEEIVGRIIGVQ